MKNLNIFLVLKQLINLYLVECLLETYQKGSADITNNEFEFNGGIKHTHQGSINNLCNDEITKRFEKLREKF